MRMTQQQKESEVASFNEMFKVGQRIRVWKGRKGDGPGIETVIAAPGAFLLGGHTPAVKIPGDSIALTHVTIL
jgi:hypothetical protein